MSQKKKKDLYLGKSLKDLNGFVEKNVVKRLADKQCRMYTKTAEKLYQNAMDQNIVEQDEEKAYILFMRFLSVCEAIRKTEEYKKQKIYYDDMLTKKTLKALEEAEVLSTNLKQRYEELEAVDVSAKLNSLNVESKTAEVEEQKEQNNKDETTAEKAETTSAEPAKTIGTDSGLIGVTSLYNLLIDGSTTVLILDVRSQHDFNASHIMHKSCINVPPTAVKPGCISKHIENVLPEDSKDAWKSRGNVDFVVIVDWSSSPDLFKIGTLVQSLKDAIFKWEQEVIMKSSPLLLEGGYAEWLAHYPTMSTNPHVQTPVTNAVSKPTLTLDQIGYDLDLDFLKDPEPAPQAPPQPVSSYVYPTLPNTTNTVPGLNNRPQIPDRSLKQPMLNGPLSNNTFNRTATDKNNVNILSNNAGSLSGIKSVNSDSITIINNDIRSKKTTNLNELRSRLETQDDSTTDNTTTSAPSTVVKRPAVNRTLKPQAAVQGPSAEVLQEQQKIEEEKRKLEQQREELREKLKHEQEQYDRLRKLKLDEAKATAELMRKKREVESSMSDEQTKQSKVRPDDTHAERVMLEKLRREEQQEEERMQIAQHRLAAEIEAERKQKQFDEQILQLEEKEREVQEKIKEDEQRIKEENERKEEQRKLQETQHKAVQERIKREQEAKQIEQKQQGEKAKLEENERLKRAAAKQLERQRLEKERAALLERERLEKEKIERLKREKEQSIARAEQSGLEREKAEKENAAKLRREQELRGEADRKAVIAASNKKLPPGWETQYDQKTRKYFYIDHATQQSHWEPPRLSQKVQPKASDSEPKVYTDKLRDETDVSPSSGSGLKRSYSSPNVAKMVADEERRSIKPLPGVDRSAKPISNKAQLQMPANTKRRNFDGVWGNVGSGLTGLRNMGNTCYMNSTLQCLSNTALLTHFLITDNYLSYLNRENRDGTGGELAEEFAVLVKNLWSAQYRSITPRDFKYSVGRHNSLFAGYEQLDSQEFLLILLDSLHEDLNRVRNRPKLPEQQNDGVPDATAADKAWEMHKTVHDSIMVDLFQGQYKSTVMCKTCDKKSVTFDTFMYLSLDIPTQSKCSLTQCLLNFSSEEQMTGDSRWNCPRCKVKRDAVKRIVIWKIPPITIIVLKRFYYKGMWRQKISTTVDYPLEGLDLNRYVSGPHKRKPYNLYAVSNHFGTLDGGHYTAFCKNPKLNKWYKFDDHEVYECSKSNVKSPAAYFLFYSSIDNTFH